MAGGSHGQLDSSNGVLTRETGSAIVTSLAFLLSAGPLSLIDRTSQVFRSLLARPSSMGGAQRFGLVTGADLVEQR